MASSRLVDELRPRVMTSRRTRSSSSGPAPKPTARPRASCSRSPGTTSTTGSSSSRVDPTTGISTPVGTGNGDTRRQRLSLATQPAYDATTKTVYFIAERHRGSTANDLSARAARPGDGRARRFSRSSGSIRRRTASSRRQRAWRSAPTGAAYVIGEVDDGDGTYVVLMSLEPRHQRTQRDRCDQPFDIGPLKASPRIRCGQVLRRRSDIGRFCRDDQGLLTPVRAPRGFDPGRSSSAIVDAP